MIHTKCAYCEADGVIVESIIISVYQPAYRARCIHCGIEGGVSSYKRGARQLQTWQARQTAAEADRRQYLDAYRNRHN